MTPEQLIASYKKIAEIKSYGLPDLEPDTWGLTREPKRFETYPEVIKFITKFEPVTGWLGFQSATVLMQPDKTPPALDSTNGILLNAELVSTDGKSLTLRYDSAGGWLVTTYSYEKNGECLADLVKLVIHGAPGGFLYYKRFWCIGSKTGAVPFAACLIDIKTT